MLPSYFKEIQAPNHIQIQESFMYCPSYSKSIIKTLEQGLTSAWR